MCACVCVCERERERDVEHVTALNIIPVSYQDIWGQKCPD